MLTLRGGYNKFNDDYSLPYDFDADHALRQRVVLSGQVAPNRFPTTSITGYKGTGWNGRQTNGYYQVPARTDR